MKKAERHTHIRERADALARTGAYPNWLSIEHAIRSEGFAEARSVLDDHFIRAQLNNICKIAQSEEEKQNRIEFDAWLTTFVRVNSALLEGEFQGVRLVIHESDFSIFAGNNQLDIRKAFASRQLTQTLHFTMDGQQYLNSYSPTTKKPFGEFYIDDLRDLVRKTLAGSV